MHEVGVTILMVVSVASVWLGRTQLRRLAGAQRNKETGMNREEMGRVAMSVLSAANQMAQCADELTEASMGLTTALAAVEPNSDEAAELARLQMDVEGMRLAVRNVLEHARRVEFGGMVTNRHAALNEVGRRIVDAGRKGYDVPRSLIAEHGTAQVAVRLS